jgi:hypothetical protein
VYTALYIFFPKLTEREGLLAAAVPTTTRRARIEHFMVDWILGK